MNSSLITPAFLMIGLALFSLQILREYYRSEVAKKTAIDHASKVFPHANEQPKPYQRKP
jgi:ABC-type bacteriocin/lantibiotic exporter with double-glycine peptidase domain